MLTLKAGFYIDEINNQLRKIVGAETLTEFFDINLIFTAKGLPQIIKPDKPSSLIKVAWNIISRGEPTRASLYLVKGILLDYLKDNFTGIDKSKPEITFSFKKDYFQNIDKADILELLKDFGSWDDKDIVRFGAKLFSLNKVLREFITAAQVQYCILLYLLENEGENKYYFSFEGIHHSLGSRIIQDLNNLFTALNSLAENEQGLPHLKYDATNNPDSVKIGINEYCDGIIITQFSEPAQSYFSQVFAGEHVNYRQLSKYKRIEQKQEEFEYKTLKQKNALEYFLQNIFRKNKFRPGQEAIINRAIQTKDVIGLLPTGGGKSLTYQLCALLQPGVTVVVDPINSLMKDQYDKLLDNGITKTAFINSSISKEEKEKHLNLLADGKYQFIFISPERFQIQEFRDALLICKSRKVFYSYAVIDEAHCVSEWGHDFRHSYLKLAENIRRFCLTKTGRLPLFGLTATASFDVLADVQRELDMQDDAIVTLPAKAIDREELHFEIRAVDYQSKEKDKWHQREKDLGKVKYPVIKNLLKEMPGRISVFEKEYGFLEPLENFYGITENGYENAGVIFCPSKSDKLPFGVLHLKNGRDGLSGLDELDILNIGTFFGSQDDDTVQDGFINQQAKESAKNQEAFIKNETNLMIATKAFGMGIDKPNIRFTIHYTFPNSVESFYQEAGRAGRDGKPSLCSIIYNTEDIQTNYDFYAASFRGVKREKEIIDELLDEVHYEDDFFMYVLQRKMKEKFPEVYSLSLFAGKYIYLNGKNEFIEKDGKWLLKEPDKAIKIGRVTLNNSLNDSPKDIKNFDINKSKEITNYLRETIRFLCPEENYEEWILQKSAKGINTILKSNAEKSHQINIGFNNDVISMMTKKIKNEGIDDFKDVYIRAAYKFSKNEEEFIESLYFNYSKDHSFSKKLILSESFKITSSKDKSKQLFY